MTNQSRRKFLKGLGYGSALAIGGISTQVLAGSSTTQTVDAASTGSEIHYLPAQEHNLQSLSLYNHTQSEVVIEGIERINLGANNQLLAVKVGKVGASTTSTTLAPGESRELSVVAANSDYRGVAASHRATPITVLGSVAA